MKQKTKDFAFIQKLINLTHPLKYYLCLCRKVKFYVGKGMDDKRIKRTKIVIQQSWMENSLMKKQKEHLMQKQKFEKFYLHKRK